MESEDATKSPGRPGGQIQTTVSMEVAPPIPIPQSREISMSSSPVENVCTGVGDDTTEKVNGSGHVRKVDCAIKIALSLYKVQQNIYLLDFQRVEVSIVFASVMLSHLLLS